MEIGALSYFREYLIRRYLWERCHPWLTLGVPFIVTLSAALVGLASNTVANYSTIISQAISHFISFSIAVVMFVSLRLWDDLEDREVDRLRNPQRLLCQISSVRSFWWWCQGLMLFVAIALSMLRNWVGLGVWCTWLVILGLWYWNRTAWGGSTIANYHVVLLKYPLMALVLTGEAGREQWTSAGLMCATVYLLMCVAEVAHDASIRKLTLARFLAITECLLLSLTVGVWIRFT